MMDFNQLLAMLVGSYGQPEPGGPSAMYRGGQQRQIINSLIGRMGGMEPFMGSAPDAAPNAPEALYQQYGLNPNEARQQIMQSLGLVLSPEQQQKGQMGLMELLPKFMSGQADIARGEAAKKTAETGEGELKVKQDTEARELMQFQQGTPQDKAALYEMNLKNIALMGSTIDGKEVPKDVRQNAFALLRGVQQTPGLSQLISQLAEAGEWETAGRLVGLPAGAIQETWRGHPFLAEGVDVGGLQQGLNLGETGGMSEADQKALQDMTEGFRNSFFEVLQKAKEAR
jgi:hypothetical protein